MGFLEYREDAQQDFQQGTLTNVVATTEGSLELTNNPALSFDGVDDYVAAGTTGVPTGNAARTVEAWIRPTADGGSILAINTASGQKFIVQIINVSGTWYLFTDGVNSANNVTLTGAEVPPLDAWSHLAFVFDGAANTWRYYLNGALVKSGTFSIAINTAAVSSITIGTRLDVAGQQFNGIIDEVRLWSVARAQADIQTDMNRELSGSEPGLVGYWKLNEGSGTTAYDASPSANHGTIYGATWTVNSRRYVVSGVRTSPIVNISPVGLSGPTLVLWSQSLPSGTSIVIETNVSFDGGTTWQGWQPATNGGPVPGIPWGADLSNARLQIREALSTTDTTVTPALLDLLVRFGEVADLTTTGLVPVPGELLGTYTVIPVGISDFPCTGLVKIHSNLPTRAGVPPTGELLGTYTVMDRPTITLVLSPVQDAWIWEAQPHLNYGEDQDLPIGRTDGARARSLIQWDLSSILPDLLIKSATIRLTPRFLGSGTLAVHALLTAWQEYDVTWRFPPSYSPAVEATASTPTSFGQPVEFDITPLFLRWYRGQQANRGVLVVAVDEQAGRATHVGSREYPDPNARPQLRITHYLGFNEFGQSDLPTTARVRRRDMRLLPSAGTVQSTYRVSPCTTGFTAWAGPYEHLRSQSFAQSWNLPGLCSFIREAGSDLCNRDVWESELRIQKRIYIDALTWVDVTIYWVWGGYEWENPYAGSDEYCYCRLFPGDPRITVWYGWAYVNRVPIGDCGNVMASQGAVNRKYLGCAGLARAVSDISTSGYARGFQTHDIPTIGRGSRQYLGTTGIPRFRDRSDLATQGVVRRSAASDMSTAGQSAVGPNSLASQGTPRVPGFSVLASTGQAAHTPDLLDTAGFIPYRSDLASTGMAHHTPDLLASTGRPRVVGVSDFPSGGHASGQYFPSGGLVRQVSDRYTRARVPYRSDLPTIGYVLTRGADDLPCTGIARQKGASDLLSMAWARAHHSDMGTRGIVTAVVLELHVDLSAWPPEGSSPFPQG